MIINWSKLQPYKLTKQKSFEQLCYQIAIKLFDNLGIFTPIDDSGGGDGVEFYLTLKNGQQWGWQAKYYEGSARLNQHNRKQKIINSLERAIEVHPNLSTWYLCLPLDLTPDETKWFKNELPKHIPYNQNILIGEEFLWNESFIHEKLNQPEFNGLKQAFFNELELSAKWFQNAFNNSFTLVGNKFDDLLYVANAEFEYWSVNPILCNEKFREERIKYYPKMLRELYQSGLEKIDSLNYTNDEWRLFFEEYKRGYTEFNEILKQLLPKIEFRYQSITPNQITLLSEDDFNIELELLFQIEKDLDEFRIKWHETHLVNLSEKKKEESIIQSKKIWNIESVYKKIIEELRYYIRDSSIPEKWRVGYYLGNGGTGKTNFSIALAKQYLDKQYPAIFIPAIKLTASNPLHEQILSILDIKSIYSFSDFLDCLNELGKIYNQRVPIILDGLNEAINLNGFLNDRLHLDIPFLENEILQRANVVLITTCRTSYKKAIWGDVKDDDTRFHSIYGFTNEKDKKRLVRKYFEYYKIQADLSFLSLQRFTKPLYLKIFCESVNLTRKKVKQVTLGYDSIYTIFEKFVTECDLNIFKRIQKTGKYPPIVSNKRIASKVLIQLAEQLWVYPTRAFTLEELMKITDSGIEIQYNSSIAKALLDEELLFIRNWSDGEENIYLTYDLMAGYFIASYLLNTITDYKTFFNGSAVKTLIGEDFEKLHPNYEDVLDSLCSLLPIKKRIFVHDLIDKNKEDRNNILQILFETSIKSTVLLSPEYIPKKQVELLKKLGDNPKNIVKLISFCEGVLFVSGHPFNFSFWSKILKELSMNERDYTWSEYLRNFRGDFVEDLITEFRSLQEQSSLTDEQVQKIYLAADFLIWTFTSTNKSLKEKAADALYLFAIKFLNMFLQQYYKSAGINDPTIFEWMNLVLYNVLITITKISEQEYQEYEDELKKLATFLSEEVLDAKGHYATNHLITRNYTYSILKLLVRKFPKLSLSNSLENLKKQFRTFGTITWEEAEDLNKGEYSDGNSLLDYYFNKEKMPHIMVGRGNEYNETPEFRSTKAKLRWRSYQLGYSFQLFGEIDKQIAKYKHYEGESAKTERYADKYIDMAFLEYCGYLDGLDKFKSYDDFGYLRTFELKHDPSKIDGEAPKMPNKRFVSVNYIDTEVTLQNWCTDNTLPDINSYLIIDRFQEKVGKFVLLDCIVHQNSMTATRQLFFKIDTIFIKNKFLKTARLAFAEETKLGWAKHSTPNTLNIHESEIPDADIIPYNEFISWYYSNSSKIIDQEYTKMDLIQHGKMLNEEEADSLWKIILESLQYVQTPRTNISNTPLLPLKFHPDDTEESIQEVFKKMNIELRERKITNKEVRKIEKKIKVFIPVRTLKSKVYLCKNIIDYFNLSSKIGNTDLFDEGNNLASFNFTYLVDYVDQEAFTYIRKDLLDRYLEENQLTMFTLIWGERDYYPPDGDWMKNTIELQQRQWSEFYKAIEYKFEIQIKR